MTYENICRLHSRYHCIDCGYRWYTVDDAGTWHSVEGTGDWFSGAYMDQA